MKIAETKIFKFAELSLAAQNAAIAAEQQTRGEIFQFETADFQFEIDDFKTICEIIGIQNTEFSWSGFYSQGDGLSFTGEYFYATQALAKIVAYAPNDTELHKIVAGLQDVQKRHGYRLSAAITRRHCRYSHENSVTIQAFKSGEAVMSPEFIDRYCPHADVAGTPGIENFEECFRDLMRHIFQRLQREYEYQTSEDAARDCLTDCEFTADGNVWSE